MKPTTVLALALASSSAALAHGSAHGDLLSPRSGHGALAEPGMHRLVKKQLLGGLVGALTGEDSSAAAGGASSAAPATSAAAEDDAGADATSAPASVPAAAATSAPATATTSAAAAAGASSPSAAAPVAASSSAAPAVDESSASSAASAPAASSSSAPASSARDAASSAASESADRSSATESAPSSASSAASSGSSTAASSSASSSASAAADKKDDSSSGGISKAVLIPIIVVASVLALIGAVWTIVRKTKFSPSRRFEAKLAPIDYAPDAVHRSGDDDRDAILAHARNGSQMSAVGHGATYGAGGAHYAPSLARSDSGKTSDRGGMAMSESMHNVGGIPYNGPAYVQAPYYGAPAYGQAQAGYPHEQAYAYGDLHRAGSFSNMPYADPRPSSPALSRMPTSRSGMASPAPAPIAYDYGAQARAASRNQVRY
ncbi:hypothetical protein JCM10450v2_003030 [Rhodotorula kratochvilovae]